MNDHQLDELLRQSAPVPSRSAVETATLLARQAKGVEAGATPLRTSRRPTWLAGAAVAGVLSLTGAGTLAAYQLSIPPFQTLEAGVERSATGIPVNYRNSAGQDVECLAFIEYQHLDAGQRERIEAVAGDDRWNGYGQRVLDRLAIPHASPEDQQSAVSEVVFEDLWLAARSAVPNMANMEASDGPVFNGASMSCDTAGERR